MIDSTGAENVSAASSGSRIVRSARSTSSAAPSANSRPPNRPPSAGQRRGPDLGDAGGRRLARDGREHVGRGLRDPELRGRLAGAHERREELDALEREVERVDRSLLRHRRRAALVPPFWEVAVRGVVTKDAVVHDRHQLHELGVDPPELGVQLRDVRFEGCGGS